MRDGYRVVPDIVANAGTTAWFTWLATGEIPPEAAPTFDRLHALMRRDRAADPRAG